MIFRADEGFKECPGLSSKFLKEEGLPSRQFGRLANERPADPPRKRGRSKPKAQDRHGHCQSGWSCECQIDRRGRGNQRRDPHHFPNRAHISAIVPVRIVRRCPLQKPLPCEQRPHKGAPNRIQTETSLEWKAYERKENLSKMSAQRAHGRAEMLPQKDIVRLPNDIEKRDQQGGSQQNADHGEHPKPRWGEESPSEQH